jgi:hypothetical protein
VSFDADFLAQKLKNKVAPAEITMTLKIRHTAMGDITLNPSNLLSISEFKTMYI